MTQRRHLLTLAPWRTEIDRVTAINEAHQNMKMSVEIKKDGHQAFLDIMIYRKQDGTLGRGVYRKPTHTNLDLNSSSHHHPAQKKSVLHKLIHTARKRAGDDHIEEEL